MTKKNTRFKLSGMIGVFGGFLLLIWAFTALPALSEDSEGITLQFGIYTAVKPSAMIEKFRPVTAALEESMKKQLGKPVKIKFKVAATYKGGIKNIAEGKVDFSRFGPASFIEARGLNSKLSIVAVESKKGSVISQGIICVRQDSKIEQVGELKGKSFAFGNELSTIGRYLSQQHLLKNGVKASDLSRYEYLGRHDAVGAAVGNGRFDAGALKESTFLKLKKGGTPLRELARFPNAPQTWIAKEGLDDGLRKALSKALLELTDTSALSAIGADDLVEGKEEYYKLVQTSISVNKSFFE